MSLFLASTSLPLLAAAPATSTAPAAQELRLHEGLSAGFRVDGTLEEWKQPASVTFGADTQVAGEVRDDRVQLSRKPEHVHADHVEVWLALPQPTMVSEGPRARRPGPPRPHDLSS